MWNSPEKNFELTQKLATERAAPHLQNSHAVTIVDDYYAAVIEGLYHEGTPHLEIA